MKFMHCAMMVVYVGKPFFRKVFQEMRLRFFMHIVQKYLVRINLQVCILLADIPCG